VKIISPRVPHALRALVPCSPILIAYDADDEGQKAARKLLPMGPRFRLALPPEGHKSAADAHPAGVDLRPWLDAALDHTGEGQR
jgi:hypothetical protein